MTDTISDDILTAWNALLPPRQRESDWLWRRGVSVEAYSRPHPVKAAGVRFGRDGRFSLTGRTDPSRGFVFLDYDGFGNPADLVAWNPAEGAPATLLGRSWALGDVRAGHPFRLDDPVLRVYRDPLGWLRAERQGIVILDAARAREELVFAAPVAGEDAAHVRDLRERLTRPSARVVAPRRVA